MVRNECILQVVETKSLWQMASYFQRVHRIKRFRDWITAHFIWKILIASLRQDDTVEIFRATSRFPSWVCPASFAQSRIAGFGLKSLGTDNHSLFLTPSWNTSFHNTVAFEGILTMCICIRTVHVHSCDPFSFWLFKLVQQNDFWNLGYFSHRCT